MNQPVPVDVECSRYVVCFPDRDLGSSQRLEHDREPEGQDGQHHRLPVEQIPGGLHHPGELVSTGSPLLDRQ